MITTEVDFSATTTKPEGINSTTSDNRNVNLKVAAAAAAASSSANTNITPTPSPSSWTRLKDPRIVRVSRAFGGKDRHSKVCTVRGLRDRRVRLSVPTAIQLYDLQDRLGLNQPSKVVDWLLNAAKHEIDELPPLQLPPAGNFNPNLQQWLCSAAAPHNVKQQGLPLDPPSSMAAAGLRGKSKELAIEAVPDDDHDSDDDNQDQNWTRSKAEEEKQQQQQEGHDIDNQNHHHHQNNINLFPRSQNLMNNVNAVPLMNSLFRWDPSSLSLSQHHYHHQQQAVVSASTVPHQHQPDHHHHQDFHNFNVLPSALPHPFFHPHSDFESRQINFQMLSSASSLRPPPIHDFTSHSLRPLHFIPSHNNPGTAGTHPNKENDQFHSS